MSDQPDYLREIFIARPPEIVFGFLVDPELIAKWIGESSAMDARPGGLFRVKISPRRIVRGVFTELTPPYRMAFSWDWGAEGEVLAANRFWVEIDLKSQDGGTLVCVRHNGLPECP